MPSGGGGVLVTDRRFRAFFVFFGHCGHGVEFACWKSHPRTSRSFQTKASLVGVDASQTQCCQKSSCQRCFMWQNHLQEVVVGLCRATLATGGPWSRNCIARTRVRVDLRPPQNCQPNVEVICLLQQSSPLPPQKILHCSHRNCRHFSTRYWQWHGLSRRHKSSRLVLRIW